MDINFELIGMRIKTNRKRKKLTQAELAERVGISATHLSFVETAKKHVSLCTLARLSTIFGMSVDELLWGNGMLWHIHGGEAWNMLLLDCTSEEQEILLAVSYSLKQGLRHRER